MLKPLTAEGRFECGLDEIIALHKHRVAFVARPGPEAPHYRLGLAEAGQPGYWPVPVAWCHATSYDEMREHVEQLNREMLDCNEMRAAAIVASSIGAQNRRDQVGADGRPCTDRDSPRSS